jgi:hypothetical protein
MLVRRHVPIAVSLLSSLAPALTGQALFPGQRYEVGFLPRELLHADMQGDGILDVVCLGESGGVNVYFGGADGTLTKGGSYGSYKTATDGVLVDANLDGHLDFVSVHGATSSPVVEGRLVVQLGNAQGVLTKLQEIATGGISRGIARGDYDDDGLPDYVTVNSQSVSYSVLKGLPSGAVSAPTVYLSGTYMYEAEPVDIGADGVLDLVAVGQGQLYLFTGNGQGGVFPTGQVPIGANANGLVLGKIDADAKPDAAYVSGASLRVISDLYGSPSESSYALTTSGLDLAFGDFDGNGRPDALTTQSNLQCALLHGNSGGSFGAPQTFAVDTSALEVDVFDVDGDGRSDALAAGSYALVVAHGNPSGVPQYDGAAVISLAAGGSLSGLHCADLDQDGDSDVLYSQVSSVGWLAGDGAGALSSGQTIAPLSGPYDCKSGDLDGDGVLDLVVANETGAFAHRIAVLRGTGAGAFEAPIYHPTGTLPVHAALGDLNLDGDLDVSCATLTGGLSILLGASGAGFSPQAHYLDVPGGDRSVIGDFDANGTPDVVLSGGLGLVRFPGVGGGALGTPQWITAGVEDRKVTQCDIDGDGRTDLATSGTNPPLTRVHLADGSGGFEPALAQPAVTGPADVLATDLDGDGQIDLASYGSTGNIGVRLGAGDGSFGALQYYGSTGSNSRVLAGADLDSDGRVDLLAGVSSSIAVYMNKAHDTMHVTAYGIGTPGCGGASTLGATSMPQVGAADFGLISANVPPGSHGFLLVGAVPDLAGFDPFGLGVLLHVDPFAPIFLLPAVAEQSGTAHIALPIPPDAALGGVNVVAQALWPQPLAPCSQAFLGLSASRGASIQIQP